MATRVYRANPGEQEYQVTDAAGAATTKLVELTVDFSATGVGGTRRITENEVRDCVERILAAMMGAGRQFPPV